MFVGEGPGQEEDRQGLAFVGRAGQLLTRIIAAIGLSREEVFIANIVKCRPPKNRDPKEDEVATCLPFLQKQIDVIDPDIICALGAPAARALLDTRAAISRLRGRFHIRDGISVMPTFHPAYLLRNPSEKRPVWEDMQKIQARLKELEKARKSAATGPRD
jgi:DNA polymerase